MARIEYKSTPGGIIERRNGDKREGVTVIHIGNPVYAESTGVTLYAGPLTTNIDGEVPGWLEAGIYTTLDPTTGKSITFEVGGIAGEDAIPDLQAQVATLEAQVATLESRSLARGLIAHAPTGIVGIDMPMLEELLGDTPEGAIAILRDGQYAVEGAWGPDKNITIQGDGTHMVTSPRSVVAAALPEFPDTAPWLQGTVILQTQAGANGVEVNESGKGPLFRDLGIMFEESIRFLDTGHGIYSHPTAVYSGAPDFGWTFGGIDNVTVYGHDGDHYGVHLTNPSQLDFLRSLKTIGGGGLYMVGKSSWFNCGNLLIQGCRLHVRCGGTAHGVVQRSEGAGRLNLLDYQALQVIIGQPPAWFPGAVADPDSTQYLFKDEGDVDVYAVGPTCGFESSASGAGSPIAWGAGRKTIGTTGYFGNGTQAAINKRFTAQNGPDGSPRLNSHLKQVGTILPYLVANLSGSYAGVGSGASVSLTGDDYRGVVYLTTGSAPATITPPAGGRVVNIPAFQKSHFDVGETVLGVMLSPLNADTPRAYATSFNGVSAGAKGGFDINLYATAPASKVLAWAYDVIVV